MPVPYGCGVVMAGTVLAHRARRNAVDGVPYAGVVGILVGGGG